MSSLLEKTVPFLVLASSFLICFRDWFANLTSKVFLSLDMTFAYYPLYHWVHEHLVQGHLPFLSDLAYNGAPIAAVVMIGVLSPALWLFHSFSSFVLDFNLLFLAPFAIYLFGIYALGRQLGLSKSGSLFLAFLWSYNGHQMAQLDHLNVAWAHAFFPWTFLCLARHLEGGSIPWLLTAGLLWGLNVLSGHPQVVFLEGLFFLAWVFWADRIPLARKLKAIGGLFTGALLTASPLLLFTWECRAGEGFGTWSGADKFFHSWTPLNFLTLVFPWFFGRDSFDHQGSDYWWQYQFVEMQVAFSLAGLFFILLFLTNPHRQKRWIAWTSLFALLMAMGRFTPFYALVSHLPAFSWFRDPARYWFLATWTLGLGAAYAWDDWFKGAIKPTRAIKLGLSLFVGASFLVLGGRSLLTVGRPWLDSMASWFIRHFLLGDSLHTQSLSTYLARLPEKWDALATSLDPRSFRVLLPLLFAAATTLVLRNKGRWSLDFSKAILLLLVFVDLMVFRMPLGSCFVDPSTLPKPIYPAAENRSFVLLSGNVMPTPAQYAEMAFPNMNFLSGRRDLAFVANPPLPGYENLLAQFGWFSWVYKDRDPIGFAKDPWALKALGVDQIVSDVRLKLPWPFRTVRGQYPFLYRLDGVEPPAAVWYELPNEPIKHLKRKSVVPPRILQWNETRLLVTASDPHDRPYLYLQKTWLPGWKLWVNGNPVHSEFASYGVLMTVPLKKGESQMNAQFDPNSLRLGFFLFFLMFGAFCLGVFRRLSP